MKRALLIRLLGVSVVAAVAAVTALVAMWPASPGYAEDWAGSIDCRSVDVEEGDQYRVKVNNANGKNFTNSNLKVYWFTDPGTADASDYVHQENVRQISNGYQRRQGNMGRNFPTIEDHYPELDETFTIRFRDHTHGGRYSVNEVPSGRCTVTIRDDDGVGIYDLEVISSPANGRAYRAGEHIEILARFNGDVTIAKPVLLSMNMSSSDGWWRGARLDRAHQSIPRAYVFRYTVQPGDMDDDGINVLGSYSDGGTVHGLGGGGSITVRDTGDPINPWFRGLDPDPAHKVDGRPYATATEIISTPASQGHYRPGETIKIALTYNQAVDVDGDVRVSLRMGAGDWWRSAGYQEGSGTDTLVFGYEVRPGDFDDNGISMDGGYVDENGTAHGYAGGGAIKAAGTDVLRSPRYPGLPHDPAHKVDGVTPVATVTDISVTSTPGKDRAYGVGDSIDFTVTFSADVTITGPTVGGPTLTLELDEESKSAIYLGHVGDNQNQALFSYKVKVGDTDADGIFIGANALNANQGSIRDQSGYDVDLTHAALPTLGGHRIRAPGGL